MSTPEQPPEIGAAPEPGTTPEAPSPVVAHIVYGLYVARFLTAITPIIGLIMAYVRRRDVAGTYLESHFTYQIRTFWLSFAGFVVSLLLVYFFIGYLLLLAITMWLIYRIAKGWLRLADGQAILDPQAML